MTKRINPEVAVVIGAWPPRARSLARRLRRLIYDTARRLESVGPLTETLKWGEPAYLTERSKTGSTIRFAWKSKTPEQLGLYFNCQTGLVDQFRTRFPELVFEGNRAIRLNLEEKLPEVALGECIAATLTYHVDRRAGRE